MFGKSKPFASLLFPFTEPSAEVDIYWGLKQKLIIELPKEPVG
jgi:phenylalanyl-tRNA synthetase alpha subunit